MAKIKEEKERLVSAKTVEIVKKIHEIIGDPTWIAEEFGITTDAINARLRTGRITVEHCSRLVDVLKARTVELSTWGHELETRIQPKSKRGASKAEDLACPLDEPCGDSCRLGGKGGEK